MENSPVNILLIGFGAHAKRIYYPIYLRDGEEYNFKIVYAIDLEHKKQDIESYLRVQNDLVTPIYYLSREDVTYDELSLNVSNMLDEIVRKFQIKGVILATEPLAHIVYARWALRKGLSILIDKPISTYENISTDQNVAEKLIEDYKELMRLYKQSITKYQRLLFSVMVQRRYHPVFRKTKELLKEVFQKTNCPVTSIQSFHSDGQWRLPTEIIDIGYHPFNQGYGKCSHSGYHFFDIVPWMLATTESREKQIDNVDVFSNFLRPRDFIKQLNPKDYRGLFSNYCEHEKYSSDEFDRISKNYGEIDAFNSFAFKNKDRTITLGSINLAHNGFSQRGWLMTEGRDLYKGNGRLRHETHIIEQGPFQAIALNSFQSKEVDPNRKGDIYDVGGEYHFDMHVFRNSNMFAEWKAYERFSVKELNTNIMEGKSRGHQEDAKREAILEFVRYLNGGEISPISDLGTHWRGVQLMYGVYKSATNRYLGKNPLVNIDF
jgi:predicted dehydrogenase